MSKSFWQACPAIYITDSQDEHFLVRQAAIRTETPLYIQPTFSAQPVLDYLKRKPPFEETHFYPNPAFVLCDYKLGSATGCAVCDSIRSIRGCAELPFIMFGGSGRPEVVAESYSAGADHFLRKPVDVSRYEVLVQALYVSATTGSFEPIMQLREYRRHIEETGPAFGVPRRFGESSPATTRRCGI